MEEAQRGLAVWGAVSKSGIDRGVGCVGQRVEYTTERLAVWDAILKNGIDTEGLAVCR